MTSENHKTIHTLMKTSHTNSTSPSLSFRSQSIMKNPSHLQPATKVFHGKFTVNNNSKNVKKIAKRYIRWNLLMSSACGLWLALCINNSVCHEKLNNSRLNETLIIEERNELYISWVLFKVIPCICSIATLFISILVYIKSQIWRNWTALDGVETRSGNVMSTSDKKNFVFGLPRHRIGVYGNIAYGGKLNSTTDEIWEKLQIDSQMFWHWKILNDMRCITSTMDVKSNESYLSKPGTGCNFHTCPETIKSPIIKQNHSQNSMQIIKCREKSLISVFESTSTDSRKSERTFEKFISKRRDTTPKLASKRIISSSPGFQKFLANFYNNSIS